MQVISRAYQDTINLGRLIARHLKEQDIICLFGQLGAGKTVLVKGLAEGLGIKRIEVVSPSFILLRIHEQARITLYHFDLYRLNSAAEISAAGLQEYLYGNGVAVVEWADRLKKLLPEEFLKIELFIKGKNSRLVKISARGGRYKELLHKIYENISH